MQPDHHLVTRPTRGDPPRRRKRRIFVAAPIAIAVAAFLNLALMSAPSSATETGIGPQTDSSEGTLECNGDYCPKVGEAPPPADPEFVEQLPPKEVLERLPDARPDGTGNWTLTVGRGTDGHYCGSFYIHHVSYTFNYYGDYTRIHVQPTRRYQFGLAGKAPFVDGWAWDALSNCISTGGPHGIYVRSWDAIEDQFLCHAAVGPLAGRSWDLEGHREATDNPLTWAINLCNW